MFSWPPDFILLPWWVFALFSRWFSFIPRLTRTIITIACNSTCPVCYNPVLGCCHMFHQEYHVHQYGDGSEGYIFIRNSTTKMRGHCYLALAPRLYGWPELYMRRTCIIVYSMLQIVYSMLHNRGVTAVEDLVTHAYSLARLPRSGFGMYPEEWLGIEMNSASMMWKHIDDMFSKIWMCMSAVLCTVYAFWQVSHLFLRFYAYRTFTFYNITHYRSWQGNLTGCDVA